MTMERQIYDLHTLQTKLRSGIESVFPSKVWLSAEISAMKARAGGHCYLELSQSKDSELIAKAQGIIWRSRFGLLSSYFEKVTGTPLQEGITVLVLVQVTYTQLYGLSLIIDDIDPAYTLGDKEKIRRQTIERLEKEGLMEMQKQLQACLLPRTLAVISAEDAAGYRDFMRHLSENPYGFTFITELYPAMMQGAGCPASILAALDSISGSGKTYDLVLILRGGGSNLDLACFDDYDLCAGIARHSLPVYTAIGHDQDYHIADMVAYGYVKTPTALADEIVGWYADEDARLLDFATRLKLAFTAKISAIEGKINVLEAKIHGADPRNIIKRGYILALDNAGVTIKRAQGRQKGDKLSLMFADGTLGCVVENVTLNTNDNGKEGI